ncbi:MAG: IS3 family transposase [Candidatus Poribacteria bacterium]|nr:IS3 family transposase [Candidatus Poribacteria bacterium]
MRQICEVLGFNKSTFSYQSRIDVSEDVLRADIRRLAAYPTYGYRRITKLLVAEGHTVGYKRGVSRLMKEENLLVSVKRVSNDHTIDGS